MSPTTSNNNNSNDDEITTIQAAISASASATRSSSTQRVAGTTTTTAAAAKTLKLMSYQNVMALLALLLLCGSNTFIASVDGLKCYMCGQYNEGVGSITPCLNYSDQYAHLYLKECPKKSEKFCVKYVSELSTVRDCATECAEKEIWETQTYCCNQEGCNGSSHVEASVWLLFLPLLYYACNTLLQVLQVRR